MHSFQIPGLRITRGLHIFDTEEFFYQMSRYDFQGENASLTELIGLLEKAAKSTKRKKRVFGLQGAAADRRAVFAVVDKLRPGFHLAFLERARHSAHPSIAELNRGASKLAVTETEVMVFMTRKGAKKIIQLLLTFAEDTAINSTEELCWTHDRKILPGSVRLRVVEPDSAKHSTRPMSKKTRQASKRKSMPHLKIREYLALGKQYSILPK